MLYTKNNNLQIRVIYRIVSWLTINYGSCAIVRLNENVPNIPITAKIRAGWDSKRIVAIEAGLLLEKIGIKASL